MECKNKIEIGFVWVFVALFAAVSAQSHAAGSELNADSAEDAVEEVIVTGSRIQREDGYDQPSPVTTVSNEMLLSAAPSNIADALNQLPQFTGSLTRTSCCGIGSSGNFLNLRGLGTSRVLILLDGDRVAPTRELGDVDVNLLPEMLISRVDVVTGGASAAYGSDAVSGVVNYVIDQNFDGVKVTAQGAQSTYGDNKEIKFGLAVGNSFADGRGHIVASLEHYESDGLRVDARSESRQGHYLGGFGIDAIPFENLTGVMSTSATNGGVIVNAAGLPVADDDAPLAGTLFLPEGGSRPFVFGTPIPGITPVALGGDGYVYGPSSALAELRTDKFYTLLNYDFSDTVSAYARINAAESATFQFPLQNSQSGAAAYTIFRENAFLPAAVADQMDSAGVSSFRLARQSNDWGMIGNDVVNQTYDVSAGFNWSTENGWDWKLNASHGQSELNAGVVNNAILDHVYAAADAVVDPSSGEIVCNVTLTNPGEFPGCRPLNVFGENAASQAALDFVLGRSEQVIKNQQDVFAINTQGRLFDIPSGEVVVAAGVEHIRRSLDQSSNSLALSQVNATGVRALPASLCPTSETCRFGRWNQGNFGVADASDSRNELFAEVLIPLLSDTAFANYLELNGAYRYTDYENSGGVDTWKIGLDYQPTDSLRIRGTRSRDIRAPNLFEMFAGATRSFGSTTLVQDPLNPTPVPGNYVNLSRGNPNLEPEIADTYTIGFVYQPAWLSGFSGSIDYFDIELRDSIADTTPQSVLDRCAEGDQDACGSISRDAATNTITQIVLQRINLDRTIVRGVDFDLSYSRDVGPGFLQIRMLATKLIERSSTVGTAEFDFSGFAGGPEWRGNLTISYEMDTVSLFWQQRYIDRVRRWLFLPPGSNVFANPEFASVSYTDVTATWNLGHNRDIELYGTINNLFNKKPPVQPTPFVAGLAYPSFPTGNPNYDIVGTQFTVGARVTF